MEISGGVVPPNEKKFEREKKDLIERIKQLEDKIVSYVCYCSSVDVYNWVFDSEDLSAIHSCL